MTREEAQKILATWLVSSKGADGQREYIDGWFDEDVAEAFRMAIGALKAPTESTNTPTDTPTNFTSKADAIDAINAWLDCAGDTVMVLPSADAVKLVRCKDCKHLGIKDLVYGYCKYRMTGIIMPDDFCSYGERKKP